MGWELLDEDYEELKKAIESGGVQECVQLMEQKRDGWKTIDLNVAVVGNSGVGKSSFINAIRRLTADDEGGAIENIYTLYFCVTFRLNHRHCQEFVFGLHLMPERTL